jgi:hypothetical protein
MQNWTRKKNACFNTAKQMRIASGKLKHKIDQEKAIRFKLHNSRKEVLTTIENES